MEHTRDDHYGPYTNNRNKVIESELNYINKRRENYDLDKLSDTKDSWGICFSGGGIRSATLCLGIIQKLTKANLFKLFDYLSTVSGGGYIGSCLTSLLSKPKDYPFPDAPEAGVEPENSPFVGLNGYDDYGKPENSRLGVRHQLHHLRTHGEYLIPRKDILSRDVQRAIGTLFAGILHHLVLFSLIMVSSTALLHVLLFLMAGSPTSTQQTRVNTNLIQAVPFLSEFNYLDNSYYIITDKTMRYLEAKPVPKEVITQLMPLKNRVFYKGRDNFHAALKNRSIGSEHYKLIEESAEDPKESQFAYVKNELRTWLYARLLIPLKKMLLNGDNRLRSHYIFFYLLFFLSGISVYVYFFSQVKKKKDEIYGPSKDAIKDAKSGFNAEGHHESLFISKLNKISFLTIASGIVVSGIINKFVFHANTNYFAVFFFPLGFAIGAVVVALYKKNAGKDLEIDQDRVARSFYNGIQGAALYCIILSILIPVGIVFLFSINYFKLSFWWTLISLALSYTILKKSGTDSGISKFFVKFYKPLLMLLILLFIALTFDLISDFFLIRRLYLKVFKIWGPNAWLINGVSSFIISILSTTFFIILGSKVNSNRISPHYFYRDRLTEAYLKTDARVQRAEEDNKGYQGMPKVSVRNHESLKLSEVGVCLKEENDKNKELIKGPYHIIVAALNLQGSDELNRKTMLSEHFIFSKEYVGSKVTGYVRTKDYRDNMTKLARAMTISAAAAGSGMGFHSFGAQAFATTLFNVRLGYWMANPWYYKKGDKENPEPKRPFWPWWLMQEMLNKMTAREKMVNLSDGGHTGDNLGLLPLLQRRCKVIVVCDGEADGDYHFNSFNNAVRMAYIEENIEIDIDLTHIVPDKNKDGSYKLSKESVAIGKITYPPKKEGKKSTTGKLIYLKSSMSEPNNSESDKSEPEKALPVHVKNYHKGNSNFPHQTTADQFFDDAQFEAYRALGEHIADQAILKTDTLKTKCNETAIENENKDLPS